jgi:hypothetical protein
LRRIEITVLSELGGQEGADDVQERRAGSKIEYI